MEIKVSKNNWEIISSGYVVVSDGEYVDFSIDNLRFKLTFETVENVKPRVGYKYEKEGDYMTITCQNFNKANFRTVIEPLILAKINGRDIALELSVTTTSNQGNQVESAHLEKKILFYCWYISKENRERHSG